MATFNMSKFCLEDVDFFTDERLDNINVYSVVLVTNSVDFDLIITDFCKRMCEYSCVQMIQESGGDFTRFTFVSHVCCPEFSKAVLSIVGHLELVYGCRILVY